MAANPIAATFNPASVGAIPSQRVERNGDEFSSRLDSAIQSVSQSQNTADVHLGRMASGESVDIHATMIALQEADIQLRTMVSVRDKVVDAYQQIMAMQV
jgi:flagellar hook-basal body complex protein FliE